MATQILKSLKGRHIRLTRLDSCGNVVVGDCSTIVTDGFISVTIAGELESGDEYIQKNAWGDLCINEKDGDQFKRVTVTLSMCEVDPDTVSVIGGDAITQLVDGAGDTIGFAVNTNKNVDAFALEVWTKVAGADCTDPALAPWGYFVVPFIKNGRPDGDFTIENGTLTFNLYGEGFAAENWGNSPYVTNPLIDTFPADHLHAVAITTEQPPAVTDGCVAYAAP